MSNNKTYKCGVCGINVSVPKIGLNNMSKHEPVIKDIKRKIEHYEYCIKDTLEFIIEKENQISELQRECERFRVNIIELNETLELLENDE